MIVTIVIACILGVATAQKVPCGTPVVQAAINNGTKRIVGGKEAVPGSWPWMVMIVDDLGFISGSGAIIGSRTILTSAQHFEGADYHLADVNTPAWSLHLGSHNIDTNDLHQGNYTIASVAVFPSFNYLPNSLAYDIALIFTNEPIMYNDHTRPICIPEDVADDNVGQMCYLAGWGSTSSNGNEDVLNQVDIPILSGKVCQQHYAAYNYGMNVCAGYKSGGKGFCADDIGSPLMCQDASGTWYTQGIASLGGDCTLADKPGIFNYVGTYLYWIKNEMKEAGHPYEY